MVSSDDEEPLLVPVRRSKRARTPAQYFLSELPSVTPQPAKTNKDDKTSTEEVEVDRSEYELRSHATPRKSPRRQISTHYFNSELPQPHKHPHNQQPTDNGWIAEEEPTSDEVVTSYKLRSTRQAKEKTNSTSLALSSNDEEDEHKERETSVTPRISLYETRMRKRLNNLTNATKKKMTDALTSLTGGENDQAGPSSSSKLAQPPTTRSQTAFKPPVATVSSSSHATTSSHTTRTPPINRMRLRSTNTTTSNVIIPPDQTKGVLSTDSVDPSSITTDPLEQFTPPTQQMYPQWMRLGWEEIFFAFVLVGLMIFAYYCFNSESC